MTIQYSAKNALEHLGHQKDRITEITNLISDGLKEKDNSQIMAGFSLLAVHGMIANVELKDALEKAKAAALEAIKDKDFLKDPAKAQRDADRILDDAASKGQMIH